MTIDRIGITWQFLLMGIPLRIEYPGALDHIPSRGNAKKSKLLDEAGREEILLILTEYHNRHGILGQTYGLINSH